LSAIVLEFGFSVSAVNTIVKYAVYIKGHAKGMAMMRSTVTLRNVKVQSMRCKNY
jgi:hypothetical protein